MSADEIKKDDKTIEVELPELTRDLEKMTVKELREIGLKVPSMVGVHSMKKAELVSSLKEVYGIEDEVVVAAGTGKIKAEIKALQDKKAEANEAGDKKMIEVYRRKISRLKKKTRKIAKAAKAA